MKKNINGSKVSGSKSEATATPSAAKARASKKKVAPKAKRTTTNRKAKAAAKKVVEHADAVVSALLGQACKGNTQSAKFLFDFAGIYPCPVDGDDGMSDSMSNALLGKIGLPVAESAGSAQGAAVSEGLATKH